jgi:hypothetical protein
MKRFATNNRCHERHALSAGPSGTSSLEVLMAFTLLVSVLAFSTPLIVRHNRLLNAQRDYRLALDEASNQLDRLSILPAAELSAVVERLQPSAFVAGKLTDVKLHAAVETTDVGQRIRLSVSWGDEQRAGAPVALAAWFPRETVKATDVAERRESR